MVDLAAVLGVKPLKPGKTYKWQVKTDTQNTAKYSFRVVSTPSPTFTPTMTPGDNFQTSGTLLPTSTQMPITKQDSVSVNTLAGLISAIETCTFGMQRTINMANSIYSIESKHSNASSDGYDLGGTGLPPVQCTLTIEGNGSTIQRGSRTTPTQKFRIFTVLPTGNLTIRFLTIKGGSADATGGAGILNHKGWLSVFDSTITQNQIQLTTSYQTMGAGIYTYRGSLFVTNSTISNNSNQVSENGVPYGDGGGIAVINDQVVNQSVVIQSSNIINNTASRNGGAIAFDNFVGYSCC